jgi:hypothetical protein
MASSLCTVVTLVAYEEEEAIVDNNVVEEYFLADGGGGRSVGYPAAAACSAPCPHYNLLSERGDLVVRGSFNESGRASVHDRLLCFIHPLGAF